MPMKTVRMMFVSSPFRQYNSCFGLFYIAGHTQYMYIVYKFRINYTPALPEGGYTVLPLSVPRYFSQQLLMAEI